MAPSKARRLSNGGADLPFGKGLVGKVLFGLAVAGAAFAPAAVSATKDAPKALEPEHALKPAEGYFDEAFALEPGGARLYLVRTDGATFAKLEIVDLASGKTISSFDLPKGQTDVDRLEPLPDGKGVVVISREGKPEAPTLTATLVDGAGKAGAQVGPTHAFGRPSAQPELLVAFDRKVGSHENDITYTVTPYTLATLAPLGKPRVYKVIAGELKAPPFRVLDFIDGYARAIGERPRAYVKKDDVREPPRTATLDTLTGKVTQEDAIGDVLAWAQAAKLRARHPGRAVFTELNQDDSGVDVVNAMGKKQPVELAVPFGLYDAKSLTDQEGPETGALYFGLAVDPVNAEAVKRKKADLPMLDIYGSPARAESPAMRARIFMPRSVTWKAGYGKVVVLKRFKSFTRGGDELDVYKLR
jgi:hypothetical protein